MADATPKPSATSTTTPAPDEASPDPGAELDQLLGSAEQDVTPTAKARILFAKAQLAFMRRQIPEEERNYQQIADKFKPADLSSIILGYVGDYLLSKKQSDKAKVLFNYLLDEYPKSDVLDFAYNGLGQIAFDSGDYKKSLQYCTDAIDNGAASAKFKDLTIGKARSLYKLNRYAEAKPVFEEIAANRDWRGPVTAESLFSLGDMEQQQGRFAEAIAYYQRVYVAYQRYPEWVAKAYFNSGECFEKMGKNPEAINTYKEMLRNEKLTPLPEAAAAKKRLDALGGGSQ